MTRLPLLFLLGVFGCALSIMPSQAQEPPPDGELVTTVLRQGLDGYTGVADSYLSNYHNTYNFGGSQRMQFDTNNFVPLLRYAVFVSEGGPVPDGAVIEAAQLKLHKGAYNNVVALHALLVPWSESEVTWDRPVVGASWSAAGARGAGSDYAVPADAQITTPFASGWIEFDVQARLQAVSDGGANHGWLLLPLSGNNNLKRFHSSEYTTDETLRPTLEVSWSIQNGAPENQPPEVALTSPVTGASAIEGTELTLAATASDVDGSISEVRFLVDGVEVGVASQAPYTVQWTVSGTDAVELTAEAVDDVAATTLSSAVTLDIQVAPPPPTPEPPPLSNPNVSPEAPLGPTYNGALSGSATVSAGGNAAYNIPLELPPARRGLVPDLSLVYNSNLKNSTVGLGWFLQGQSSIVRCPKTLIQDGESRPVRFDSEDRYCMDGHKLVAVSGAYGANGTIYRTEVDQFKSIRSSTAPGVTGGPASFEVRTKDGLRLFYGTNSESRLTGQNTSVVRTWALRKVVDASQNYYQFNYYKNTTLGQHYITSIEYNPVPSVGAGGQVTWQAPDTEVTFLYEDRPDSPTHYEAGSQYQPTPKRVSNIQTRVNGNLVLDYQLTYETVGADSRSRLVRIDKCDAQGECQEPIKLDWWDEGEVRPTYTESLLTVPYFHAAGYFGTMTASAKIGQEYNVPRWHDMNGDGKPDYVHPVPGWPGATGAATGAYLSSDLTFKIMLSQGTGYVTETWTAELGGHPKDFTWVDIDGDGRTDIVKLNTVGSTCKSEGAALSTGSGFQNNSPYGNVSIPSQSYPTRFVCRLADMNGDGLIDIVRVEELYSTSLSGGLIRVTIHVHLNNGNGFNSPMQWSPELVANKYDLVDLTGDGLLDVVANGSVVYANTGFQIEGQSQDFGATPGGFDVEAYVDVNGDGLLDRRVRQWNGVCCEIQLNTGQQFLPGSTSSTYAGYIIDDNALPDRYHRVASMNDPVVNLDRPPPTNLVTSLHIDIATDDSGASFDDDKTTYYERMNFFHQWTDLNGDGLRDLTLARTRYCYSQNVQWLYAGSITTRTQWRNCEKGELKVLTAEGAPLNLLRKVWEASDLETEFIYKPLTDTSVYTKGTSAVFPDYDIQDGTRVVSQLKQSNGIGGHSVINYTYEGLVRNVQGRGNLGFEVITTDNLATDIMTVSEYSQTYPHTAKPVRVSTYRGSDLRLLNRVTTNYGSLATASPDVVFSYVDNQVKERYALEGAAGRLLSTTTTSNSAVDVYGNIGETEVVTVDHENALQHKTLTLREYAIDSSPSTWRIRDLVVRENKAWRYGVNDPAKDRKSVYTYHSGTGYLLSETREPGGGVGVEKTTARTYDAVGNVASETVSGPGITSRTSTISYDNRLLFPASITNPLGHVRSMTWERGFGNKLSETDPNGVQTTYTYASFGLPESVDEAGGSFTEYLRFACSSCNNSRTYIETRQTGSATKREYYDQLGRPTWTRTQSFGGQRVNVVTQYNAAGRAHRKSEPYFDGTTKLWNTMTFDLLGRETSLVAADPTKSRTTSYDGFETTVTDVGGRTRTTGVDALGQIIRVVDEQGSVSEFDYDAMGNRVLVTNAVGTSHENSVSYDHDRLGRLIAEDDPNRGLYTYSYDALDNRLSEVSPKLAAAGQSITYQYNKLNRPISRSEPEGTTTWVYDNVANGNLGLGQVHSESMNGFSKVYSYSAFDYGRLTSTTTTIGSETYTTLRSYDAQGRISTEQYPDNTATPGGFVVQYTYSPVGHLEAVESLEDGSVLYQLMATDASGRTTEEWLGDGSRSL
ncbi:DNRLRE domain-containing protein [Kineobactrum salinum]|uniref:DNRLRE domain-containing protein n=1 Tax=Kineobactrum salinum TaxID=2708301 RepID=A0A6C0TYB8_9GAMM|nr:DNRLRE domain-containing protein [Kineobactrum salinum]QIB64766.1 DNRLRE domain-containing protein [Kineobactrum salinum]